MSEERSTQINLLSIFERVVKVEGAATSLHSRVDKVEASTRDALQEIAKQQGEINKDLKEVIGWMNRGKGWAAAAMLLSGMIGAGVWQFIGTFFKSTGKS